MKSLDYVVRFKPQQDLLFKTVRDKLRKVVASIPSEVPNVAAPYVFKIN